MNASFEQRVPPGGPIDTGRGPLVVVQQPPRRRFRVWLLMLLLFISVMVNFGLYSSYHSYLGTGTGVTEKFDSGDILTQDKIALIDIEGTISPPFTSRVLKAIKQASEDDHVKGVVLVIDSPGGLVADSHEIYHELRKLDEEKHKPIYVSMTRLAASGGYYVAMGAGPDGLIFAEPTTWTGSIGVILPHYNVSGLAERIGVQEDSLKTGPFKDTLSMFRKVTDEDRKLWTVILDETLNRFLDVIVKSRKSLDLKKVRELATGQVFTASQAKERKMIDEIGFRTDAVAALKTKLNLSKVRVVKYETQPGLAELLFSSKESAKPEARLNALLDSAVPRAYYLFTMLPGITAR